MTLSIVPAASPRNRLLQALPPGDLAELWPQLEPVELTLREVLQVPEQPMEAAWFVETGMVSMIAMLENGDGAEVGIVGNEGLIGLPLLLDDDRDDLEGLVQMAGTAFRIPANAFQAVLERLPQLRRLLNRYALVHYGQVARTGACNGRHHTDDRLARWLLMAHDRAGGDTFPITHEMLGMMLAVRRAGVTVAAGVLQKAGLIRYSGGRITITDRPGLEAASCDCYGVTRRAKDRLFGLGPGEHSYWH
ncbi:Crp/Fnr family transcriptional regulator [Belnapia rosea]|uniref:cAMP-binding domain of CRP or a regulatory subunit of cAMP-dependent protein kinases n=1 Tax=Belnapia rosea TaxID=938405 RepID=A0A1G6YV51_9PROT|nr:Crp/Fnr family transcriptional regulator [Belnapia rosea]SDD94279.1 cAMP-binding domain of CRP or a regulatory subunit of cAMP-dependent protein kinases [Belnapia rosea]